jgi:hypothetical protein
MSLNPHCEHCGMVHLGVCPRIRSITYRENGTIERIEYHPPGVLWSPSNTFFAQSTDPKDGRITPCS